MSQLSNLSETAEAILATAVVALGARVPARQYIATGIVAYDQCEQITCSWVAPGLYIVDPFPAQSRKPVRCAAVLAADFILESTRCMTIIQGQAFPDPADLTNAAEEVMADGEILMCALLAAAQSGVLFGGCRLYTLGRATPYGPSGAVAAVRIPITVQMTCTAPGS